MTRILAPFVAASIAGLLAQADESLWTKSAWGIMCLAFLSGVTVLFKMNQQLHCDRLKDKEEQIAVLKARVKDLERE